MATKLLFALLHSPNNQDRYLVLRRKKKKSLDYNNSFLGEYECSSLALDREEMRDEKEEIGSLETKSNNVTGNSAVFIGRKTQRSLLAVLAVPDISGGRQAYQEAAVD
ncbi:hypothetical protein Tco_0620732 [Tanacetum coccineum]